MMNRQSESSNSLMKSFIIFLLFLVILLALPISLRANGFTEGSLFTDTKAGNVGDLLTVLIFEDAQASNQTNMKTEEDGQFDASGGPGIGPFDFIPLFSAKTSNTSTYEGKGSNSRKGSIKAKMTVEVVAIRPNGDLVISGSRVLEINSEQEIMKLSGLVRCADIKPDNTVDSYNIANARISYSGKGPASSGSSPGLISRVLNWIF